MDGFVICQQLVDAARLLYERHLNSGYAGNLSIRDGDIIWITPAAKPKHRLTTGQIVPVGLDGHPLSPGKISSESQMHFAIYRRRPDVKAIVHAHPPYLSIAACSSLDWAPLLPEMEIILDGIAWIPYLRPGTEELAESVAVRMADARLGILANHGAVTAGANLEEACDYLEMGESLAQTQILGRLLGGLRPLPSGEAEFFRGKTAH